MQRAVTNLLPLLCHHWVPYVEKSLRYYTQRSKILPQYLKRQIMAHTQKNNPGKIKQVELYLAILITTYQMKWRKYPMFSIPLPICLTPVFELLVLWRLNFMFRMRKKYHFKVIGSYFLWNYLDRCSYYFQKGTFSSHCSRILK